MRKVTLIIIAVIALFTGALAANASSAEQTSTAPVHDQSLLEASDFGIALSGENLDAQSGRQAVSIDTLEMMFSNVDMNGSQHDNSITGSTMSGANTVTGDAFSNMNGFATVIQNSGNQVLIQNDLIVNVNTH